MEKFVFYGTNGTYRKEVIFLKSNNLCSVIKCCKIQYFHSIKYLHKSLNKIIVSQSLFIIYYILYFIICYILELLFYYIWLCSYYISDYILHIYILNLSNMFLYFSIFITIYTYICICIRFRRHICVHVCIVFIIHICVFVFIIQNGNLLNLS